MSLNRPTAPAMLPISSTMGVMVSRRIMSLEFRLRVEGSPVKMTRSKSSQTLLSSISFIRGSGRCSAILRRVKNFSTAGLVWVILPSRSMATMPSERPLSMLRRRLRSTISVYRLRDSCQESWFTALATWPTSPSADSSARTSKSPSDMATAASRSFSTGSWAFFISFSAMSQMAARAQRSPAAPETRGIQTPSRAAEGACPPLTTKKTDRPTATAMATAIAAKSAARLTSALFFLMR